MSFSDSTSNQNANTGRQQQRIVVALGGNALLRRGEAADIRTQRTNARLASRKVAPLADCYQVVITHGNGPQIGHLALQQAHLPEQQSFPLDVLGAESEALIGYLLEQELRGILPSKKLATILTLVEVDPDDPAMAHSTKPIGPIYSESEWQRLSERYGWQGAREGQGLRRVVPSPAPQSILQSQVILDLLATDCIPICAGGGGIPVTRNSDNELMGLEAVIDKDWTSARLAAELAADKLVLLTDVDAIYQNWGETNAFALPRLAPDEVNRLALAAGSMGPKAAAAAWFTKTTGKPAAIGALSKTMDVVAGHSGTQIEEYGES